jgi:hypothetical protein
MPGKFICYRCKADFRDHYGLQRHYDKKKKCVAVGTVVEEPEWHCVPCKSSFSTKGNYTIHLKSNLHERMTTDTSAVNVTNNNSRVTNNNDNSTNIVNNTQIINNIQINLTPRDITSLDYDYLPSLTAQELKKELGLDMKNLEETILNTFRSLHTNAARTENHNILIEFPGSDQALVFKAGSWRLEDKTRALNDCICQCAVHLLDLEDTIKELMDDKEFKIFSMYRDDIERESARETDDHRLKSLLAKVSDILVSSPRSGPRPWRTPRRRRVWPSHWCTDCRNVSRSGCPVADVSRRPGRIFWIAGVDEAKEAADRQHCDVGESFTRGLP